MRARVAYKSLCAAVTIYATIVNIQTHTHIHTDRQNFDQLILTARPAEPIITTSGNAWTFTTMSTYINLLDTVITRW